MGAVGVVVLCGYVLACALYLWTLLLSSIAYRAVPPAANPWRPVVLLVPAHDEAGGLGDALLSISALRYPRELLRVVVIADNCSDSTAAIARTAAGVEVLERFDAANPGKGQALAWAIARLGDLPAGGAVAILDADCTVGCAWLEQAHAHLDAGALAVQASYGTRNGNEGWAAGLTEVGLTLFNHVRPAGRARLGMSAGLNGSGMVFSNALLGRIPWTAGSITEDLEYAAQLAAHGVSVAFDPTTRVLGLGGAGSAARTQRARWEGGRFAAIATWAPRLLAAVPRRGGRAALGAALDLMVLPLGLLVLLSVALEGAVALAVWSGLLASWWLLAPAVSLLAVGATVPAGLLAAGAPRALYMSLLVAPAYVAWKVPMYVGMVARRGRQDWVRTARQRSV